MKIKLLVAAVSLVISVAYATAAVAQDSSALIARLQAEIDASSGASAAVKAYAKEVLLPICSNVTLVAETIACNAAGTPLSEIQRIDQEWQEVEEPLPIMEEKLGNACAQELLNIVSANPAIIEAFVMDNQGAIVGANNLTSDYWQGDEPKWQNSYSSGQGGVDIGEEKMDRSANAVIQQISLPIIDESGNVVGAITFGVSTSEI